MKLKGIKKACGETRFLSGYYFDRAAVEIFIDIKRGTVAAVYHSGAGFELWNNPPAPDMKRFIYTTRPLTMQEITDAARDYIENNRTHSHI